MIPLPKIGLRGALELAIGLLLLAALAAQTVRIDGVSIWPLRVSGLKAELADVKTRLAETQAAFRQTVINYQAAAEQARIADVVNAARVKAEQARINERTEDDTAKRIFAARAAYDRLRAQLADAAADPRRRGAAAVPGLPVAAGRTSEAPAQDRLPGRRLDLDDRLIATEQAIRLDELISWTLRQHAVEPNGSPAPQGPKP